MFVSRVKLYLLSCLQEIWVWLNLDWEGHDAKDGSSIDQRLFLDETRCQRELVVMWQLSQIAAIFHQSVTRAELFWSKVNTEPTFCTWPSSKLGDVLQHNFDSKVSASWHCDNQASLLSHYWDNMGKVLQRAFCIILTFLARYQESTSALFFRRGV